MQLLRQSFSIRFLNAFWEDDYSSMTIRHRPTIQFYWVWLKKIKMQLQDVVTVWHLPFDTLQNWPNFRSILISMFRYNLFIWIPYRILNQIKTKIHTYLSIAFDLMNLFEFLCSLVHPVINVRNQLVGSPFEKDVTIECNVEASPKSINYWIKDVKDGKFVYCYFNNNSLG